MSQTTPASRTYLVAGMSCDHCKVAVTEEVARVAGVTDVAVDLEAKLVSVQGSAIDGDAVVAAIDEAGYDAGAARGPPPASPALPPCSPSSSPAPPSRAARPPPTPGPPSPPRLSTAWAPR